MQRSHLAPRILVIRLRRLGDLLLVTPALRAIRAAYPRCRLDVAVEAGFEAALHGNPHIDSVLHARPGWQAWVAPLAAWRGRYDVVLDLQSSTRSALMTLLTRAPVRVGWRKDRWRDRVYSRALPDWNEPIFFARKMLRATTIIDVPPIENLHPDLAVAPAAQRRAATLFETARITAARPVVALSVVANAPRKRWPAARFAELADRLVAAEGAQLVMTHGPGQLEQVRAVVSQMRADPALWDYGDTTLAELAALYQRCDLWVGNDGGAKHVAAAVACPTVTIISARGARIWIDPDDTRQVAVPAPPGDATAEALRGVSVEQVYEAASARLAGGWKPQMNTDEHG